MFFKKNLSDFIYDPTLSFINLHQNDQFTLLKGYDLQELLVQIEKFYLIYRYSLGLPDFVTFGLELEYEDINHNIMTNYMDRIPELSRWGSTVDASLDKGGEINSPILRDEKETWQQLKLICNQLQAKKVCTNRNAGGHIHIGSHVLGEKPESWIRLLKLWITYEPVIFRFGYGDQINHRSSIARFAPNVAEPLLSILESIDSSYNIEHLIHCLPTIKYQAISFSHVYHGRLSEVCKRNTIEFRCFNSTAQEIIWQNNVNFSSKFVLAARYGNFREDIVEESFEQMKKKPIPFEFYDEIFLSLALELVDIVFDNNLDKVYFLRQYLKSFERQYGHSTTVPAKKFVMKK